MFFMSTFSSQLGLYICLTDKNGGMHEIMAPVSDLSCNITMSSGTTLSSDKIYGILKEIVPNNDGEHITYIGPGGAPIICPIIGGDIPCLDSRLTGEYRIKEVKNFDIQKF